MSQIKRQRREHLLAVRKNPSLASKPSGWRGPSHPGPSPLALEEASARALRPRSLARRVIQLWRHLDLHAPHLVGPEHRRGIHLLAGLPWVRDLDRLGPVENLRAFAERLLARFPVAPGLLAVFDPAAVTYVDATARRFAEVAARLARGGGYTEVAPLLHGQLTRRVYANLVTSTEPTPILALRAAQVRSFGGPPWLAEALSLHRSFATLDGSPLALLGWLCREAEAGELGHVLDYLLAVPTDLAGRTWASVGRLAVEWRAPRRPEPAQDPRPFSPSGFRDFLPHTLGDWRIRELLSPLELVVDGNVMHHCVATYASHVRTGVCSIWSLRRHDRRVLTLEVRNTTRQIVQVRGAYNRRPDPWEITVVATWANGNGLTLLPAAVR